MSWMIPVTVASTAAKVGPPEQSLHLFEHLRGGPLPGIKEPLAGPGKHRVREVDLAPCLGGAGRFRKERAGDWAPPNRKLKKFPNAFGQFYDVFQPKGLPIQGTARAEGLMNPARRGVPCTART